MAVSISRALAVSPLPHHAQYKAPGSQVPMSWASARIHCEASLALCIRLQRSVASWRLLSSPGFVQVSGIMQLQCGAIVGPRQACTSRCNCPV